MASSMIWGVRGSRVGVTRSILSSRLDTERFLCTGVKLCSLAISRTFFLVFEDILGSLLNTLDIVLGETFTSFAKSSMVRTL